MSLFYSFLVCLGLGLSVAWAIEMPVYISTPSTVTAGQTFQASLTAEVHNGRTRYLKFFRVYLAISYQEKAHYFYDSDCYLVHEQSLCDASVQIADDYVSFNGTPFNVTIPSTVGPSGTHYVLTARVHQTDGSWYGASLDSEVFDLKGANGTWSSFQENGIGRSLWGDDGIPCGSYACVKGCADNLVGETNSTAYQGCANDCPDVSIDFENSTRGGQPTASRTRPSECGITPSPTVSGAKTTVHVNSGAVSTTPTHNGNTAAGNNAPTSMRRSKISLFAHSIGLATLLLVHQ